jgi:hypothetical protein
MDQGRNQAGVSRWGEVVEAAESQMATLCACRPLDVGDQQHARHLVFLLLSNPTLSCSYLYHSYAGAWTGVYFPTRLKAPS